MSKSPLAAYLHRLELELWIRGIFNPEKMAEVESHLLEAVERGLRQGLSQEDAEQQALQRFGSIKTISSAFANERITPMQIISLVIATLSGLFFAYVDSRPTWDDTGILAGAILLACGLIALIGYQRPWLLALAVGIWIPLYGIFVAHNSGSIIALIFAFAGAYTGWAIRIGIRKTFHTA